jgi:hypothetical protein
MLLYGCKLQPKIPHGVQKPRPLLAPEQRKQSQRNLFNTLAALWLYAALRSSLLKHFLHVDCML